MALKLVASRTTLANFCTEECCCSLSATDSTPNDCTQCIRIPPISISHHATDSSLSSISFSRSHSRSISISSLPTPTATPTTPSSPITLASRLKALDMDAAAVSPYAWPSSSSAAALKSYAQFKKEWRIGKQIGWGGQGSVFTVTPRSYNCHSDTNTNSSTKIAYVAKCMFFTDDEQFGTLAQRSHAVAAIRREYELVTSAQLLHYVDFYSDERTFYKAVIVMERLCHSLSNCSRINTLGSPGSPAAAAGSFNDSDSIKKIALDLAHNLQALHSAQFAHLDVKKENIMWHSRTQQWKLIDFGMALEVGARSRSRSNGGNGRTGYVRCSQFVGTKSWTAPEIAVQEQTACGAGNWVSCKCDVYAYGLVLLNLSLGEHHYAGYAALNGVREYDEVEFLRGLCTKQGHRQFMRYLCKLQTRGRLQRDLFAFLQRILEFDPHKRLHIQQVLNLPYLN